MTEPLVVDPSRLKNAGTELRNQIFPVLPSPIAAPGADSISTAINETLPIIESPVNEGLPAVKAALTRTSANIVTAADLYAEIDQRMGEHVNQVQFLAAAQGSPAGASAARLTTGARSGQSADGQTAAAPTTAARLTDAVPRLGELTGTAGALGTLTQSVMQGTQSAAGSMPASGRMSPQLADETEKRDDGEPHPEKPADGAAPGDQASESIPRQQPASRPEPAPSGRVHESGVQ